MKTKLILSIVMLISGCAAPSMGTIPTVGYGGVPCDDHDVMYCENKICQCVTPEAIEDALEETFWGIDEDF